MPYDRVVPKRPLERALEIAKKLGDKVAFFVSDFASPKVEITDPFIMVVMRDNPSIRAVFDVWNEPGLAAKHAKVPARRRQDRADYPLVARWQNAGNGAWR